MKRRAAGMSAIGALLLSGAVLAQDIPVRGWEVPADGLSKLAVVQPTVFAPVSPPCRLDDSRISSGGVGPIPASGTRVYDFIPSGGVGCGALPANVVALSVFFTVVNPSGPGFLYSFPTGSPPGSPTSILNYSAGELKNAAAIVPVNPATGAFTLGVGGNGTDVIIDLNGIFYNTLNPTHQLSIVAHAVGNSAIYAQNTATSSSSIAVEGFVDGGIVYGVFGEAGSSSLGGAAGVFGINSSAAANSFGTFGQITTAFPGVGSAGVRGLISATGPNPGNGVWGSNAGGGTGVAGTSVSGFGVYAESGSDAALFAHSAGPAGIKARLTHENFGSSAIIGRTFDWSPGLGPQTASGVRGETYDAIGVLGLSFLLGDAAVAGFRTGEAGGAIGTVSGAYIGFATNTGIFVLKDITATGTKHFVEPHPTDPSRVIQFTSLEGSEVGTYFRGRGRFERGVARIPVPEDFRIVTDSEGLGIQITPIGEMATVAVVRIDLEEIVAKASRNVEFFYVVNGVRKGYKDVGSSAENERFFVPEGPDAKMPSWLNDEAKARLISNGTYNPDGTVNLETAKKLGWGRGWAKQKPAE